MSGSAESASAGRIVRLHPLCIVGVSDHFTRVKVGPSPPGGRRTPLRRAWLVLSQPPPA